MERQVIKVYKKGIIALPRSVRERLKIEEGTLLEVYVEGGKIVLKPLDLWDRVWNCCRGSAEEAERELDREEEGYLGKRGEVVVDTYSVRRAGCKRWASNAGG